MDDPAKDPPPAREEDRPFLDFPFLYGTWTGRFKIAEFFTSLLAGALVPRTMYRHVGGFSFMSFVAWTTFIFVIVDIILHLVRLWDKLVFLHTYPQVLVCLCFLGAVSFFVASLVELGVSQYAQHPGLGYASAVFGLMCAAILAVECYYHYRAYMERQQERSVEMSPPVAVHDPNAY